MQSSGTFQNPEFDEQTRIVRASCYSTRLIIYANISESTNHSLGFCPLSLILLWYDSSKYAHALLYLNPTSWLWHLLMYIRARSRVILSRWTVRVSQLEGVVEGILSLLAWLAGELREATGLVLNMSSSACFNFQYLLDVKKVIQR